MKRNKLFISILVAALIAIALPVSLFAAVTGDPVKQYNCPFLLTSAGQGPGSKQLRLLINMTKAFKLGTDFFLEDEPAPRLQEIDSGKYKVLVAVIGTTDKGLGASGITIEDEINNLKKVIDAAKAKGMPVVAVHIEQDKRAPKLPTNGNERIIDLICPVSDWMIILKASNPDGRFDKISQQYGIPLTVVDSALEFSKLCQQIFVK
ncbi:MAG: DUF6305 family protein [Sphaerochaetaceae bacterium]|nr:DUF6305 family protein [Sphaerochaetaceae bacterium]